MRTAVNILTFAAGIFFAAAGLAAPPLPAINTNNLINITNAPYSAVGDGSTDNTLAISNAIVAAAKGGKTNGLSGGTVEIPAPGIFLCGPEVLRNNLNLQIDAGAVLRLLPYGQYPGGITDPPNFLTGTSLTNIEISGSGAIDGQGVPWWPGYETNTRPTTIFLSQCSIVLLQNFTISNTPAQNMAIKGNKAGNVTIQGLIESSPDSAAAIPSHNTDGMDLAETNCLVQNCNISVGDDNIAIGSSDGLSRDIIVTNCAFGYGHGVSIGSYTSSGVSNLTVINCTFNFTQNGIRLKSDDGRGGVAQNLLYYNLGMTNVDFPFQVDSYYDEVGTPDNISPLYAATQTVSTLSSTPVWRNITFSNITATAVSGYPAAIIWARTELPATNIVFDRVNIVAARPVEVYNASGVQFVDSQFTLPSGTTTFELFNAQITVTNSSPAANLVTFDGLTTNGYGNNFSLFNTQGALADTNVLANGPLTLGGSTLTVSNNLTLSPMTLLNFSPGTNPATVAVVGNLSLGGTNNLSAGPGFTNGTYTLLTYTGTLGGNLPVLGSTPPGYLYDYDTGTPGEINLVVSLPAPSAPANLVAMATNLMVDLQWNSVSGAASYNLKRGTVSGSYPVVFSGLTATNYADASVTNGVNYFYVVTAVGPGGESTNSLPASATPLPSNRPASIVLQTVNGQLQASWPPDHLGWQLQIQTNGLGSGLGSDWFTVPNSTNVISTSIPIDLANGSVFLRLVYP